MMHRMMAKITDPRTRPLGSNAGSVTKHQFSSVAEWCPTLCDPMNRSMPGFPVPTNSWSLLKLMPIKSVMQSNHLILCHPLLLPSIFPSIRVSSSESIAHFRWPKYWSFSFSITPSKEYSGLISTKYDRILSKLLN